MPVNPDDPILAGVCQPAPPPVGVGDASCVDPKFNYGPIVNLLIFSEQFTTFPTAAQLAALLAVDTVATPNVPWGKLLIAKLTKAPVTPTSTRYNGRDIFAPADQSYAVTMLDTKDENCEFARTTQAGGRPGFYYGIDANNKWVGGLNGLCGGKGVLRLGINYPDGEKDPQSITGTLNGAAFFDDKRRDSPIPALFG